MSPSGFAFPRRPDGSSSSKRIGERKGTSAWAVSTASAVQPMPMSTDAALALQRYVGNSAMASLLRHRPYGRQNAVASPRNTAPTATSPRLDGISTTGPTGPKSIQRSLFSTLSEREKIDAALKSGDPGDAKLIDDVSRATEDEKLRLIRILAYQGWVGPRDESMIEDIWGSFGDGTVALAGKELVLWQHCLSVGAELEKLPAVRKVQKAFLTDVQSLAVSYLAKNRAFIEAELSSLGIGAPNTVETDRKLAEVQGMAQLVHSARTAVKQLRGLVVGDQFFMPDDGIPFWFRMQFDPDHPPDRNLDGSESEKLRDWSAVRQLWAPLAALITNTANKYPSIYATLAQTEPGDIFDKTSVLAISTPSAARVLVGESLRSVIAGIDKATPKILGNDPDYRDLVPLHALLFNGSEKPVSGMDWGAPFYQMVARSDVSAHESQKFWIRLGLTSAAAAAFVVAEFATAGTATFFLAAGVGLAASGYQAYSSIDRYMALDAAAKATVKDDLALVDNATVVAAGRQAVEDATTFIQGAALVGVKLATVPASPKTTPSGGSPAAEGPNTKLSQPGGLKATEGARIPNKKGQLGPESHPLRDHGPDVTDVDLKQQITNGKKSATRFSDRASMETAIADTIEANRESIDLWRNSTPRPGPGVNRAFDAPTSGNLGSGFYRAADGSVQSIKAELTICRVILKSDGMGGYVIQSAFPKGPF